MLYWRQQKKGKATSRIKIDKIFHQIGDDALVRLQISGKPDSAALRLTDTDIDRKGITVLAIEGTDKMISHPQSEQVLSAGDYMLCYGNLEHINENIR